MLDTSHCLYQSEIVNSMHVGSSLLVGVGIKASQLPGKSKPELLGHYR